MSELEVSINKVYPYLTNILGFSASTIKGYGRVPIQMGSAVVWADYVCFYYTKSFQEKAFCVIEVKECSDDEVDFAIPQAECYAQRLNAPYFCCTNGNVFNWYLTSDSQGDNIKIAGSPTLPDQAYLKKPQKMYISLYLYEAIHNYENAIAKKGRIYKDSKWHNDSTNILNEVLNDSVKLTNKKIVIDTIESNTMQSRGKSELLNNIDNDYNRFLKMIDRLKDSTIDIHERMSSCLGMHSTYGIPKGGLFFISQLLAALYPSEYTVIEPNATKSMQRFQLTDINFEVKGVNDYLYFNEICVELAKYFENLFNFNLSYVHNFLWHHEREYLTDNYWN